MQALTFKLDQLCFPNIYVKPEGGVSRFKISV